MRHAAMEPLAFEVEVGDICMRVKLHGLTPKQSDSLHELRVRLEQVVTEWAENVEEENPSAVGPPCGTHAQATRSTAATAPVPPLVVPPAASPPPRAAATASERMEPPPEAVAPPAVWPLLTEIGGGTGERASTATVDSPPLSSPGPVTKSPPVSCFAPLTSGRVSQKRLKRAEDLGKLHGPASRNSSECVVIPQTSPLELQSRVWVVLRSRPDCLLGQCASLHDMKGDLTHSPHDDAFGWWARVAVSMPDGRDAKIAEAVFEGFPSMEEVRCYLRGADVPVSEVLDCRRPRR